MLLRNYIDWTKTINDYEVSPQLANSHSWGYKTLGTVALPQTLDLKNAQPGDEGYSSIRSKTLTQWANDTWPSLQFIDTKIQIQHPGEKCHPHLDFLGYYLEKITTSKPELLDKKHTLESPGIDVWRMFVAVNDNVDGQIFSINDKSWTWHAGECIRLDNWQALHWTENRSDKDRVLIKITGVKFS